MCGVSKKDVDTARLGEQKGQTPTQPRLMGQRFCYLLLLLLKLRTHEPIDRKEFKGPLMKF